MDRWVVLLTAILMLLVGVVFGRAESKALFRGTESSAVFLRTPASLAGPCEEEIDSECGCQHACGDDPMCFAFTFDNKDCCQMISKPICAFSLIEIDEPLFSDDRPEFGHVYAKVDSKSSKPSEKHPASAALAGQSMTVYSNFFVREWSEGSAPATQLVFKYEFFSGVAKASAKLYHNGEVCTTFDVSHHMTANATLNGPRCADLCLNTQVMIPSVDHFTCATYSYYGEGAGSGVAWTCTMFAPDKSIPAILERNVIIRRSWSSVGFVHRYHPYLSSTEHCKSLKPTKDFCL